MRKIFVFTLCIISSLLMLFSCDDYIETGIEGQWQLRKMVDVHGNEHPVDTIYYAFKKNVFRYLMLRSEEESKTFFCNGNYEKNGDQLSVSVKKSTFQPWDCDSCFAWGSLEKEFFIKKHKGNTLELMSNDTLFVFRKY